ncbi:uncharacterized protein LOC106143626 [Amyelois transitella]|uniref:uncharacterized protein LOC106143626 n=1 Tax=Amyelois transitella TaxID=680683 RepID=UPI0029902474|nr:uncharacterized protein LOC106143626 [Amyelois transitella]
MLLFVLLLCAGAAFGASFKININGTEKPIYDLNEADKLFEKFIVDYAREYDSVEEKMMRFEIFKNKLSMINEKNWKYSAIHGINMFTDLTEEEFAKTYNCALPPEEANPCTKASPNELDPTQVRSSFDWRDKNGVTPIKNQNNCGSCWAFSIIGALESQYAIKQQQMLDLSEQQVVDCDQGDQGCDGGWINNAGLYIVDKGVMSESDYPYVASNGNCQYDSNKVVGKASSCMQLPSGVSEEDLKAALTQYGPISVAVDATGWNSYTGGIASCQSSACNHAVVLVGYNDEGSQPYWIIKNSWGSQWGEQGFIKIPLGSGACNINQCTMISQHVDTTQAISHEKCYVGPWACVPAWVTPSKPTVGHPGGREERYV